MGFLIRARVDNVTAMTVAYVTVYGWQWRIYIEAKEAVLGAP